MPGVSIRMSASPTVGPRLVERAPDPSTPWCETPDAPAVTDPGSGGAPLAGVKILDLGVVIAGAYAGSMLASLGADVVKIEAPHGDPFRAYGTGFAHYNRGKRSLVLDLKQRAGTAVGVAFGGQSAHAALPSRRSACQQATQWSGLSCSSLGKAARH